jgi:GH25 family lysozyme M1 (1,4-beta-N-acetylmuramidase)
MKTVNRYLLIAVVAIATLAAALTASSPAVAGTGTGTAPNGGGQAHAAAVTGTANALTASAAAPAGYPVTGIDVSSHDHSAGKTINWANEAASGLDFAYIKATEGTSYINPYYSSDYTEAKSNGIFAGAYAFGRPDLGDPVGQADHFFNAMQWTQDGKTLPPFLDLEWPYPELNLPTCYGLSTTQMSTWIRAFLSELQVRTGTVPMIYTNVNWWNPCTGNDPSFGGYLLDIASCTSTPPSVPGWGSRWTFWQYDIPDCDASVSRDLDVFNGNLSQLAALAGAAQSSGSVVFNGTMYEFARGADHTVKYWFASGGAWSGMQTIGGSVNGAVASTVFNGTLYVYAIGTDGNVHYWYASGGSWSAMQTVGGPASGGLSASVFNGFMYVFARGTDGSVKYWFANGGPWSSIQTIGGSVSGAVSSTVFNGTLYAYARGNDGTVKYWYATGGPWSSQQTFGSGLA